MKKYLILLIITCATWTTSHAQQNSVQLNVRWNTQNNTYEVYAKPNFTQTNFTWGPSQIGIVLPDVTPDQPIGVTSLSAGTWTDKSRVFAPLADASHDFHGIVSDGDIVSFTNGVEKLIFTFILPDGQCRDGVRLFVNSSDPASSAAGMAGGDFKNTIFSGTEAYAGNYNNTGTKCSTCNIVAPELIK